MNVDTVASPVRDFQPEAPPFSLPTLSSTSHAGQSTSGTLASSPSGRASTSGFPKNPSGSRDPVIPPVNSYGTTTLPPPLHTMRSTSSFSSLSSEGERRPLLPGAVPEIGGRRGLFGSVSGDLIPFEGFWRGIGRIIGLKRRMVATVQTDVEGRAGSDDDRGGVQRRWADETLNGEALSKSPLGVSGGVS